MEPVAGRLNGFLVGFKSNDYLFLSVLAVAIGVLGGYGAVLFRLAIAFFQWLFYQRWADFVTFAASVPWYYKLFFPAVGGAVVGPLIHMLAREAKGAGVAEVMEAVAIRGGHIRYRVTVVKILSSAVTLGCGGSAGREGPIIQIGSAIGSSVGQVLRVSQDRMRTLVGCGAAAGIAATFNTPIAGVIFPLEVILGEFGVSTFSPLVLSSVTATVISRHYFGEAPAFIVPSYQMVSLWEFLFYAGLGLLLGLTALLFMIVFYRTGDLFDRIPLPQYLKPIIGGLCMGVFIIVLPHTFGSGYGSIDLALADELGMWLLLALVLAKMLATSITLGSGMSGGVIGPSLYLGAMAGGFFGSVVHALFPSVSAGSGAYALVGMGGLMAAATHAPISAILVIFELTSGYKVILPLMVVCILSTLVATHLQKGNIFTLRLIRRGIHLRRGRDTAIMRNILVQDVMVPEVRTVPENTFLSDLIQAFQGWNVSYLGVVDANQKLCGIISFRDIRQVLQEPQMGHLIVAKDVATSPVVTVQPNENIEAALRKMGLAGVSQLPVVAQNDEGRVLGVIHDRDIMAAYNRAALAMEEKRA